MAYHQLPCLQTFLSGLLKQKSEYEPGQMLAYRSHDNPTVFHQFLELPRELRDLVYEFYFESAYVVSRHYIRDDSQGTSLVLASRQLNNESVDLMYKKATLVVSLEKKHAPPGACDVVAQWESPPSGREYCSVPLEIFRRFRNVFLYLTSEQKEWRYVYPIMVSYILLLSAGQHVRVKLGVGKLTQEGIFPRAPRHSLISSFGVNSFSVPEEGSRRDGRCKEGCKIHKFSSEERKRIAERQRSLSDKRFDIHCTLSAMNFLGRQVRGSGARFYIQKIGNETKDVASNNMAGLVVEASGYLGGREGYLCMEGVWKGYCKSACRVEA